MQNDKTTTSSSEQDLITKFYYNNNHLCFQILIKNNGGESTPYMEFTDYNAYRKVFNGLTARKGKGERIEVCNTNRELTNMSFV